MKRKSVQVLVRGCLAFIILITIGCNPVSRQISVPSPSSYAKTLWYSGPVIAILQGGGESFYTYFSLPPDSILYADGRQIIWYEGYLYERHWSTREVCELLADIDKSGFFAYTAEDYEQFIKLHHMKPGPEIYSMEIHAWKSKTLQLKSFRFLFSQYKDKVDWPTALSIPYERLTAFDPDLMSAYVPEKIAVHIEKDPNLGTDLEIREWNIAEPSLSELIERYHNTATQPSASSEGEIILSGEEREKVFTQFGNNPWSGPQIFIANGERYLLAIRALLPYEQSGGVAKPIIPDPHINYSPLEIDCSNQ
jgi:hypothetical protein